MFKTAIPVFAKGREREMNCTVALRASVPSLKDCELKIAAFSFFKLTVNGEFVFFGPARAPVGHARVETVALDKYDKKDGNEIVIEVAGYYCRALSTCLQPSFVLAEIRRGEDVLAATGRDFSARKSAKRVQKAERYSQQRHYGELWEMGAEDVGEETEIVACPELLPRVAPYPQYEKVMAREISRGSYIFDASLPVKQNRYSFPPTREWGNFPPKEIPYKPHRWIQNKRLSLPREATLPAKIGVGEYLLADLGEIQCGFFTARITANTDCELVLGFTEYCHDTFCFTAMNVQNVIEYHLPAGEYSLRSFEPYTAKRMILLAKRGEATVEEIGMETYQADMTRARPLLTDREDLQKIYRAAMRTYAHNAVDLYTDCPSRERAGWLCDTYFTTAAEHHFFGQSRVEKAFLENYRLYSGHYPEVDAGFLPKCYPGDIDVGGGHEFIPQWCMWYVLQVKEYLTERVPEEDREAFRASVEGIVGALLPYENELGLLEDLPSWNFVEWSDANSWTKNVNYPTNFLWAAVLDAASELYGDESLAEKAERVRSVARRLSFDGTLFTDNALRREGELVNTGNTSEACQYYALLFGGADKSPEQEAWRRSLPDGFEKEGAERAHFVPVNAFIGLYLRIKALRKMKLYDVLLRDVVDFFGGMVEKTGTLWEYRQEKGSYDHGFASYVAPAIAEALAKTEKTR